MTAMQSNSFKSGRIELALWVASLLLLSGCPPPRNDNAAADANDTARASGTYMAAPNKIFDSASDFDLTWNVVYESKEKPFDPAINVSNRQLALNRCQQCHECGFKFAFDMEHFGTTQWQPRYKADEWSPVVKRMVDMPNSFMNEQIAERIYNYLNEETQGLYDESKDPRGGNTIGGKKADENQRKVDEMVEINPRPDR